MKQSKTNKPKRGPKDPKRGPLPSGERLHGRATAVCSVEEQDAFNAAAKSEGLTLAKWMRKVALVALAQKESQSRSQ